MGKVLRFESVGIVAVTPERLWPLLADTERMNRAVGLPPIRYQAAPLADGGAAVQAEYRVAGIPLARWDEEPFRWQVPRFYYVVRRYNWGPIRWFKGGVDLTPTEDGLGTRVLSYAEFMPRGRMWRPLIQYVVGPRSASAVIRQCGVFEQYLEGKIAEPFPKQAGGRRGGGSDAKARPPLSLDGDAYATEGDGAWQRLVEQVGDAALVDRLRGHLLDAPDDRVAKMRPFMLADEWGVPRRQVLMLFLHATTAGVLQMSWDVLCPHCRVANSTYAALKDVQGHAACDLCNVQYEAQFDRNVEVRFTVSSTIRMVESLEFCIGGPMRTPHFVARLVVEPGQTAALEADLGAHRYEVKSAQSTGVLLLDVAQDGPLLPAGGPAQVRVQAQRLDPGVLDLAPGTVSFEVANLLTVPAMVEVERPEWPDTAATAAYVSALPEFRDLFASDVLAPGIEVAIQRMTVLFTDLAGSTALYQHAGQAQAFRVVQDHFRILAAAIAAQQGTVVKTIGDAVMAVFPTAVGGVEAALRMQRDMRLLDTRGAADPATMLRVGIHQGPVLAATANERIDYFGTTVNIAARAEGACKGGQVVMTSDVWDDPGVVNRLRASAAPRVEPGVMELRGITEPVQLYRVLNPAEV